MAKFARRNGVSEQTLARCRDDFLAAGDEGLPARSIGKTDPRDRRIREPEKEIENRDQVIGELPVVYRFLTGSGTRCDRA